MMIDFEDREPAEPMLLGTKIFIVIICLLTAYGWYANAIELWHLVAGLVRVTTKSTIETTLGKVWVTHFDNGDAALWWPDRARVGPAVVDIIDGRAAWKPKYGNWIVPAVHAETLIAEIGDL
jgi:hypothetical protein